MVCQAGKCRERAFVVQAMGTGCPAHPLRALDTQSLFKWSQRSGFPPHSPFAGVLQRTLCVAIAVALKPLMVL